MPDSSNAISPKRGGYIDLQIDKARTKCWNDTDERPRLEGFDKPLIA